MKRVLTFLAAALLGYVGVSALLYLLQDRLLFFPGPSDPIAAARLAPWAHSVSTPDARLSGWLIPARNPPSAPLVLYFGGNAEDVSISSLEAAASLDANLVVMNYRGYGASSGSPSEQTLLADALTVYDAVIDTVEHNHSVVALGRSLGSGVAVHLAARRRVDALVLVTPYDSILNVAKRRFGWLPVTLMLKHRFDSLEVASDLEMPALILVAGRDEVIPPDHARNLADHWGGEVQWVVTERATHNSMGGPAYWRSIREFMDSL